MAFFTFPLDVALAGVSYTCPDVLKGRPQIGQNAGLESTFKITESEKHFSESYCFLLSLHDHINVLGLVNSIKVEMRCNGNNLFSTSTT